MIKTLRIEGWRRTCHSYALVNQYQLLHLVRDARFQITHLGVPLSRPEWCHVADGLDAASRQIIDQISAPDSGAPDLVYRIADPLRLHAAAGSRVFVFGTTEFGGPQPGAWWGRSGTRADARTDAVEIVTPSTWSRDGFVAGGFAAERVHVIPHGIDPAALRPPEPARFESVRRFLGIPAGSFVFLNIGAMTWNKGIGPLLVAFAIHRQSYPDSRLELKGGEAMYGNQLAGCRADADPVRPGAFTRDVAQAISYVGSNVTRTELAELYHVCDAYVTPYRAEGFSLPTLEALGAGRLALVTRGGGGNRGLLSRRLLPEDRVPTRANAQWSVRARTVVRFAQRVHGPSSRGRAVASARLCFVTGLGRRALLLGTCCVTPRRPARVLKLHAGSQPNRPDGARPQVVTSFQVLLQKG